MRKLQLEGLPVGITARSIGLYFGRYGEVEWTHVPSQNFNDPNRYAFIKFKQTMAARQALEDNCEHIELGRNVRVEMAGASEAETPPCFASDPDITPKLETAAASMNGAKEEETGIAAAALDQRDDRVDTHMAGATWDSPPPGSAATSNGERQKMQPSAGGDPHGYSPFYPAHGQHGRQTPMQAPTPTPNWQRAQQPLACCLATARFMPDGSRWCPHHAMPLQAYANNMPMMALARAQHGPPTTAYAHNAQPMQYERSHGPALSASYPYAPGHVRADRAWNTQHAYPQQQRAAVKRPREDAEEGRKRINIEDSWD